MTIQTRTVYLSEDGELYKAFVRWAVAEFDVPNYELTASQEETFLDGSPVPDEGSTLDRLMASMDSRVYSHADDDEDAAPAIPALKTTLMERVKQRAATKFAVKVETTLGYGSFVFNFHGVDLKVRHDLQHPNAGEYPDRPYLTVEIPVSHYDKWLEEVKSFVKLRESSQGNTLPVFTGTKRGWQSAGVQPKRSIDSLILVEGVVDAILKDVETFSNNALWYLEHSIPYRRGYMFEGPPGTGKTSTIAAIASQLNMTLCVIQLANIESDEILMALMRNLPAKDSMIVFEDIDAAFHGRDNVSKASALTFSGLLNAIDGVGSPFGQIIFMTTNHFAKLDPAIIRPGRIDVRFTMNNASYEQAVGMFKRFNPGSTPAQEDAFAAEWVGKSPAAIQQELISRAFEKLAVAA